MKRSDAPLARALIEASLRITKLTKMRSIYEGIEPASDGAVHSFQNPAGTETTRFSHSSTWLFEPGSYNLATLPKKTALGDTLYRVRDVVVPHPGRVLVAADYCVAGNTRILKTDLTWARAENIKPGDELVGFDEATDLGHGHSYRRAVVTNNTPIEAEVIQVTTDKGTVICSLNHKWLTRPHKRKREWTRSEDLALGNRITWFGYPWDFECSYEAGWLAGMADGEGWVNRWDVGVAQKSGPALAKLEACLERRGIEYNKHANGSGVDCIRMGKLSDTLRFLGQIRPDRLLAKSSGIWEGRRTWSNKSDYATVLRLTKLGVRQVYPISTTTQTYIAEGLFSHNCRAEAVWCSHIAGDDERIALQKRADEYKVFAALVKHDDETRADEIDKATRNSIGKVGVLSGQYRVGWRTLQSSVNDDFELHGVTIDAKTAKRMEGIWPARFPRTVAWWQEVSDQVLTHRFTINPLGRRRYYFGRDDTEAARASIVREAIADGPQSANAMALNMALKTLYRRHDPWCPEQEQEPGEKFLWLHLNVHDEGLFSCWPKDLRPVARSIKKVMECPFEVGGRTLVIPAEVSATTKSWSEMKGVHV